jgi:hypothetical protein
MLAKVAGEESAPCAPNLSYTPHDGTRYNNGSLQSRSNSIILSVAGGGEAYSFLCSSSAEGSPGY